MQYTGGVSYVPKTKSSGRREVYGLTSANAMFSQYDYAKRFPVPRKGAKGSGIRFETKVHSTLAARFPSYISALPFRYSDVRGSRVCIPDGIFIHAGRVVIVEIKLRHCIEAWLQLRKLYFPVVSSAFGQSPRLLEVVQFYVPEVVFPEPTVTLPSIEQYLCSEAEMGVVLWGR